MHSFESMRETLKFSHPPIGNSCTQHPFGEIIPKGPPKTGNEVEVSKEGGEESRLVVSIAVIKDFPAVSEVNELLTRDHARHNRGIEVRSNRKEKKKEKIEGRMGGKHGRRGSGRGKPVEAC